MKAALRKLWTCHSFRVVAMGVFGGAATWVMARIWMDVGYGFGPLFYTMGPHGCFTVLWTILFGLTVARWKHAGPMIVAGVALHVGAVLLLLDGVSRMSHDYRTLEMSNVGGPFLTCIGVFFGILAGLLVAGLWKWRRVILKKARHH